MMGDHKAYSNKYDFLIVYKKSWEAASGAACMFWLLFGLRYILRPDASRTTIMIMAMTSSTHMMAPRLKKAKPRSHSMISITATTKRKSSAPIFKTLVILNLAFYFRLCDCE